jgi:hypothetical protein
MSEPVDDTLVAAHLAAAVIQAHPQRFANLAAGGNVGLSRAAAQIYFDCLNALMEERVERQKAPVQS